MNTYTKSDLINLVLYIDRSFQENYGSIDILSSYISSRMLWYLEVGDSDRFIRTVKLQMSKIVDGAEWEFDSFFNVKFEDIPLYINIPKDTRKTCVMLAILNWRLYIGK